MHFGRVLKLGALAAAAILIAPGSLLAQVQR